MVKQDSENFVPIKESKRKKQIDLEWNNKTYQSYISKGLTSPDNLDYEERRFLGQVDTEVEPITRTVTKIVRQKAIDYSSPKRERKEYLVYYEQWEGRNWLKQVIAPVTEHIEGRYEEVITSPIYQNQQLVGYEKSGKREVYYIPNSKEKVDEIIEKSTGSDKDTIIFLFQDGPLGYEFPYDKFFLSFEELANLLVLPGGPRLALQKEKLEEWQKQQGEQMQHIHTQMQKKQAQKQ